ncbi:ferredoxin [Actinoalloteichus hymeniacidonis]|uniref:Ferredoxin n=1 Tax=Actinoalloteichus hymeniacidonis TaxID=340345 RepID=A0AAC9HR16_9PSEU|nr:ferredoxin [Actinoalloteichus hymeniacidonis]AOS63979.1 ferredoxin [Actinoalloteichus hymeniacidonis]MBB5907962.1 ferredoxin [Actinoalloteichus hymeniacidonis]
MSADAAGPYVHADRDVCTGSGKCVLIAPEVFDQDDDGLVLLLDSEPDRRLHDAAEEAVALCPVGALRIG